MIYVTWRAGEPATACAATTRWGRLLNRLALGWPFTPTLCASFPASVLDGMTLLAAAAAWEELLRAYDRRYSEKKKNLTGWEGS